MRTTRTSTLRRLGRWLVLGLVLGAGWAAPAEAQAQALGLARAQEPEQTQGPPGAVPDQVVDRAFIHIGPFFLHPAVALQDMGIDTNVRNERDEPQRDFTFTVIPVISGGFRAGPARMLIVDRVEYVWYKELTSERSVNGGLSGQFEVRWNRLRPFALGQLGRTRDRKGDEIDTRARRSESMFGGGLDLGIASRTWLTLEYRNSQTSYDAGESYLGVPLDAALNNRARASLVGVRFELSPLTTFAVTARLEQVRFDTSTFRDSDSLVVTGAFTFDPDALLAGSASVGYRNLQAQTQGTPDFRGVTANVALTYRGLPTTRFGAGVNRDVAYSYEAVYPYYVTTAVAVTVTQNIVGPLEIVGRGRRAWLNYTGTAGGAPDRQDLVDAYGGGIGVRLVDTSRLGFDVEWVERQSDVPEHDYKGLRLFGAVNYGF